jgi:iron complex transport system ATP-binding protein
MIVLDKIEVGYDELLFKTGRLPLLPHRAYALIGPNGSGKSTLMKHLTGELPCKQGKILINDKAIDTLNTDERAKKIAYVHPQFAGVAFLTVREYVALGRIPHLGFTGKLLQEDEVVINEILKELQLEQLGDKMTHEISDGERQLASFGRALVQETYFLLLDEPTSFLDYGNRHRFIEVLLRTVKKRSCSVLFSTHDIDLCLAKQVPMLLVDTTRKELIAVPDKWSKEEILTLGFGYS